MRSRQELVGESARNPRGVAEYAFELQEQLCARDQALAQREQLLAQKDRLLAEAEDLLARQEQLLAEARA
jgi:hypothetical protein